MLMMSAEMAETMVDTELQKVLKAKCTMWPTFMKPVSLPPERYYTSEAEGKGLAL